MLVSTILSDKKFSDIKEPQRGSMMMNFFSIRNIRVSKKDFEVFLERTSAI